jgi:sarcosine oxidase
VEVRTPAGAVSAGALVVSAGAWASTLLSELALPLTVERQVMYWFAPERDADALRAPRCPIVLWEHAPGSMFYTTPDTGDGVKAALHHGGETTDPGRVREVDADESAAARALLARLLPAAAAGTLRAARTCLYTNTPDGHFLIDRHPAHPQVLLASPCSGHGFKFGPAIGEALADMLTGAPPRFDLSPFALARLAAR